MAEKEEPSTSEAYKNVRALRTVLRQIYRGCGLDAGHKAMDASKTLLSARNVTDQFVAEAGSIKGQLKEAIARERVLQVQDGAKVALNAYVADAYRLAQVIPSYDKLPDGKEGNTLRAIEALLKTKNATLEPEKVLNAIKMVIDPKQMTFKPKPPVQKAGPKKVIGIPAKPLVSYNLTTVDKNVWPVWGYQVPYWMIPKGAPMTWGACQMWVAKVQGQEKPGKPGDLFYIHPEFATAKHKVYYEQKQADLQEKAKAMVSLASAESLLKAEAKTVAQTVLAELKADPPDDTPELDLNEYEPLEDEGSF